MSLTERQRLYLQAMDIPVWELRDALPGKSVGLARGKDASVPSSTVDWLALRAEVANCRACALHKTRTQTVFGVGDPHAKIMVIGEAPGADEDAQGEPFVGAAGKLLNEMLFAVGLKREQVFITNILKCRPPNNREPLPEEAAQCKPFLLRQIEWLQPRLILAVGRVSAQNLLQSDATIGELRNKVHAFGVSKTPLVAIYHPTYLLRSPLEKRKAWEDLQLAMRVFRSGADS